MTDSTNKSPTPVNVSDGQGCETDLEDDFEDPSRKETKRSYTTSERYLEACRSLNTVPVRKFPRQCTTGQVDLKYYGIRDSGAQAVAMALESDITVTSLGLQDNGITEIGSLALSRMLKDNCFVTRLDLSDNKIGKLGAKAMGEMLIENASLRELNLSGCGMQGKDVQRFLQALHTAPHLQSLDFSYNDLGDEGAIQLGKALAYNQTLEFLHISWNNIRALGVEELAKGIARNKMLKELDLSWNCFLDDGAGHLRNTLVQNHSLVILEIQACGIHTAGAHKIADALQVNEGLRVLKIGKNPLQSAGTCSLLQGVRFNKIGGLRELILEDVVFDRECEKALDSLLEERPNFSCSWDVSITGGHVVKSKKKPDAVEIFLTFVRTQGLRLVDLFRIVAKDSNATTVTKTEFIAGLKKLNAPLKDHQLRALFESLDVNNDDNVEFSEFLSSRSHYLRTRTK